VNHGHQRRTGGATIRIRNIFNKVIAENFPNLNKEMPIQVQEACRTPNRHDKIEPFHSILYLKQLAQKRGKNIERKIK
jgi:hypothetical protein